MPDPLPGVRPPGPPEPRQLSAATATPEEARVAVRARHPWPVPTQVDDHAAPAAVRWWSRVSHWLGHDGTRVPPLRDRGARMGESAQLQFAVQANLSALHCAAEARLGEAAPADPQKLRLLETHAQHWLSRDMPQAWQRRPLTPAEIAPYIEGGLRFVQALDAADPGEVPRMLAEQRAVPPSAPESP